MGFISVRNLKFKYPQRDVYAVNDVSFDIEKGAYVAIVGRNGSGKSSVARLLCGLDVPESGVVEIQKSNRIGIVFQSPKEQLVSAVVSRDTAFGPQNLGLSKSEVELRTIESLNIVDMLDRASSPVNNLSLGQTQKVALSGAIALRPEILILDEAISMLDPLSRAEILDFVKYWHKCGNTIIQITHDAEVVKQSDVVIGMDSGKIFFYGTKNAFFSNPDYVKLIEGEPLPVCDKSELIKNRNRISLKVCNVNFSYEKSESQKNQTLTNVNFELFEGSLAALTGVSGSGKSTLLEICAGLLECDENGKIFAADRPVLAQQNAKAALFEAFAADDVAFGAKNKGFSGRELKNLVRNAMEQAALPFDEFSERKTFSLSGGEQRRLSIAGILALNASVILFDEPTAGLDSAARFEVLQMMKNLAAEGKTVLFSTHKRDEADFADREIKIERGKIVYDSYAESAPENCENQTKKTPPAQANFPNGGDFFSIDDENLKKEKISEKKSAEQKSDEKNDENFAKLNLAEQKPCESVKLLKNLRNILTGLSGTRGKKSVVEKIPAFFRILIFFALFVFSLAARNVFVCAFAIFISLVYAKLCGLRFFVLLKAYLKILPFLLFFTIFQLILRAPIPNEPVFVNLKWFYVTPSKLLFCLASVLRTYSALTCVFGFFVSTPEYDLIDGLNVLLYPLRIVKIPVKYFIIIVEIIFRFIPMLVDEASAIIKTQIIRGGLANAKGIFAKIKSIIPLIVPLIVQSVKKSEALADAITMRCFK